MQQFGPFEIIIVLAIVLMVFGVGKLPEVFGGLGRGIREFKKEVNATDDPVTPSKEQPKA
ncbi:MAG: twin-arginine translocase TatA/TatE family subunit [Dehalococcoidia bacterium]|nr:twin-arginine translocase TatA/TatE family subunit [Dehalococcoidia bacterium]